LEGNSVDAIKIKNFEKANPGRKFPSFRSLSGLESAQLRETLARRFGVSPGDLLGLTTTVVREARTLVAQNASESTFDLVRLLKKLGVPPESEVLLNWYRFDDVDAMRAQDLADHFDHLWYPGADDLELLDRSGSWLVSVAHDGTVTSWSHK
jgi:hypothetical protein